MSRSIEGPATKWVATQNLVSRACMMTGAEMVNRITRIITAVALARSMGIAEFGVAMVALTVHELVRMFIQNGLGTRIVTAEPSDVDATATAVHRLNWALGGALMVVQLLLAWPIGAHFASPDLGLAVAALAIVHVIYPLSMVNVYIAQRNECWGQVSFAMAGQAGIDNLLTAVLAVSGFGIWAVAIPKLIVAALWVMWHRSMSPWRPCALVERPNYRSHFAYAGRVLAVEMLSTLRAHGDKALVGAMLGSTALGLYAFAANIGKGLTLSLSQALSSVILPFLSRGRASGHLQRSHRQTLAVMILAVAPLACLQAVSADWLVPLLFGAKWHQAADLVAILALSSISHPVFAATSQMLRADNRTGEDLVIASALTASFFLSLVLTLPLGLVTAALVSAVVQIVAACVVLVYSLARTPAEALPVEGAVTA